MAKILVVDDEAAITTQLEIRLVRMGYDVVGSASSGKEAIEKARRLRPDLILMDIVMPGEFDGIEAAEIIRSEMDIPCIFLTAFTMEGIVNRAKTAEPLAYVVKPFRDPELRAVIEVSLYKNELEQKLRASELRYRTLFESAPLGIALVTLEGNILNCNDFMLHLTGYSETEIRQLNVMDTYQNPEDRPPLVKRLQTDGFVRDFEVQLKRKDGSPYCAYLDITRLTLAGEEVHLTIIRDITERKRMDDLIRTQRDLGLALNNASGLEETLQLCLDAAIHVSGMDCGGVYLVDEASGNIDLALHKGLSSGFIDKASHYDGDSERTRLVMTGKPIYTQYRKLGMSLDEIKEHEGLRAILIIPVSHDGQVIACLNIASHTQDEVPSFARNSLEAIATQIGSAIARITAEEQIEKALKEKGVLLKEIHHRVKNNMQVIASLIRLQSRHIKNKEAQALFKNCLSRANSMALVHENLYQSPDISRIDFYEYILGLTVQLFDLYNVHPADIKLKTKINAVSLDVNTATPCGLILNELVSNSLKHAFPEGTRCEVNIVMHPVNENEVELIVSDTGIGFPESLDFRNTESLGMHLVIVLVEQLGGTIELDRSGGTAFTIRFGVDKSME